jgi:N-acetyl-anhydromuramyl-L-alanine amidase AmpD
MPDEPNALWIPSPNHWSGRQGNTPQYVILHGTAGGSSAEAIANWFAKPSSQVAAHYVIGQDGQVVQCVEENDAAWANGVVTGTPGIATSDSGNDIRDSWWTPDLNPNLVTVSIEHVKSHPDNSDQLTDAQKQASFTLVKHICDRHSIPRQKADANGGITGHYSIDAVNRTHCPSAYPWDELFTFLEEQVGIPNGWTDDGTTLTAPNGHKVVRGFRDWILSHHWDPQNYPLEEEHGQNPLEISDPALGGGSQQLFRMACLEWTAQRGIFVSWVGQEVLALRAEIASLKQPHA